MKKALTYCALKMQLDVYQKQNKCAMESIKVSHIYLFTENVANCLLTSSFPVVFLVTLKSSHPPPLRVPPLI